LGAGIGSRDRSSFLPPFPAIFISLRICWYCLTRRLISETAVPDPDAMRFLR